MEPWVLLVHKKYNILFFLLSKQVSFVLFCVRVSEYGYVKQTKTMKVNFTYWYLCFWMTRHSDLSTSVKLFKGNINIIRNHLQTFVSWKMALKWEFKGIRDCRSPHAINKDPLNAPIHSHLLLCRLLETFYRTELAEAKRTVQSPFEADTKTRIAE